MEAEFDGCLDIGNGSRQNAGNQFLTGTQRTRRLALHVVVPEIWDMMEEGEQGR